MLVGNEVFCHLMIWIIYQKLKKNLFNASCLCNSVNCEREELKIMFAGRQCYANTVWEVVQLLSNNINSHECLESKYNMIWSTRYVVLLVLLKCPDNCWKTFIRLTHEQAPDT